MEMIRLMIQHVRWSLEHLGWSIQSFSDNKLHIESICWVEQAQYLSALATGQKKHFKVGCGLVVRNPAENLIPGEGPNKHRLYAGQIRNFHSSFWCAKKEDTYGYLDVPPTFFYWPTSKKTMMEPEGSSWISPNSMEACRGDNQKGHFPASGGRSNPWILGGVTMGDPKKLGKARPPNWQMKEMNMALSNKLGVDYWDLNSRALGFWHVLTNPKRGWVRWRGNILHHPSLSGLSL